MDKATNIMVKAIVNIGRVTINMDKATSKDAKPTIRSDGDEATKSDILKVAIVLISKTSLRDISI